MSHALRRRKGTTTPPPPRKRRFTDRTAERLAAGETGIGLTIPAAPPGTFKPKS